MKLNFFRNNICNDIKPKAWSTLISSKLHIVLILVLTSAICEVSLASEKKCGDLFQDSSIKGLSAQTLIEKVDTLKQALVRMQAEVLAEKISLKARQSVDPKIDLILNAGSKGYAQGFYEIPGLPSRRLTNTEIAEQVTLEINNSQAWKQKITKMEVEPLLFIF